SGVLTVKTGVGGTYVINKQPPNRQIWLSSPISGPRRFHLTSVDGSDQRQRWRDVRTGEALQEVLQDELSRMLKRPVELQDSDEESDRA
ncbi:Mitochondrial chaperone Frataxin, partial [Cladochytrium tenue]